MKRRILQCGSVFASLAALALFGGCGITADTTIADALRQLAQGADNDPTLSKMTVGDLVQGFEDYAGQFGGPGCMSALSADQLTQLQDLQGQLDRGEITPEEFAQHVQEIIGDIAPGYAFAGMGMMGGPFAGPPGGAIADLLQLTDAQQQQADDIFTRLHTDIAALRQAAQDQIRALLTADQLATLDELRAQNTPLRPGMGMMGGGMMGMGGRLGGGMLPPAGAGSDPGPLGRLADVLQLTDEQQAAIAQIHTDLRAAVKARHQQARDEFRAILTADQLAILDGIEAQNGQ